MPFDTDATIVVYHVVKTSSRAPEVRDTSKLDCDDKPNDYICSRVMRAALTETGVERPEEVTAVMRE